MAKSFDEPPRSRARRLVCTGGATLALLAAAATAHAQSIVSGSGANAASIQTPGGHLKFPHLWPGQTPPADVRGTW